MTMSILFLIFLIDFPVLVIYVPISLLSCFPILRGLRIPPRSEIFCDLMLEGMAISFFFNKVWRDLGLDISH